MKKILFAFLFVLSLIPAAFSAPTDYFVNCNKTNGQINPTKLECSTVPQKNITETHRVIKGTILENCYEIKTNPSRCPRLNQVNITFAPDDLSLPQQTIRMAGPVFAFYIRKGVEGKILFQRTDYKTTVMNSTRINDNGTYVPLTQDTRNLKNVCIAAENGTRLPNSRITIERGSHTSDGNNGWFVNLALSNNAYALVSCDGYEARVLPVSELHDTITLKPASASLISIRVTNQAGTGISGATVTVNGAKYTSTYDGWVPNIKANDGVNATISHSDFDSRTIELKERTSYQLSAKTTRIPTGSGSGNGNSTGTSSTQSDKITAEGYVYDNETKQPLQAVGVYVKDHNEQGGTITDADGRFSFSYDKSAGTQIVFEHLGYNSATMSANTNMRVYLVPEHITLDETPVTGVDICGQDTKKKELHATATKWFETDEDMPNRGSDTYNTTAKKRKCIPTSCEDGYTLEEAETPNAECLKCDKSRFPFASRTRVSGNKCVLVDCVSDAFGVVGNACVLNCNHSSILSELSATKAELKTGAPTPGYTGNDFAKFCYPTACDETKSYLDGTGEKTTCSSNEGFPCLGPMREVEPEAKTAKFDGKGLCKLETCNDGYKPTNTFGNRACDGMIKGLKCSGKCEIDAGAPCTFDNGYPEHAKKVDGTKDKKDICVPVCWENYEAKLNGSKYECYLKDLNCPKNIYNLPQYKDIASKMVVTNDDSYWDSEGNVRMCRIKECKDKTQTPNPENDFQTCIDKCTEAEENRLKNEQHALGTAKDTKTGECIISECECGYDVSRDKKSCIAWSPAPSCTKRTEPSLPENAKTAHMACDNSKQKYCSIDTCINELFKPQDDDNGRKNAICVSIDSACTVTDGGQYASKEGFWELTKNGQKICVPKDCGAAVGYEVSKKTRKCVEVKKTCPDDILSKMDPKADDGVITERNSDGSVKTCQITKCKDNLDVEDGKMCVSSKCGCGQVYSGQGQCKDKDDTARQCNKGLPAHATGMGKLMCQNNNKAFNLTCAKGEKCKEVCVVQQCEDPYTPDTVNNICTAPNGNCDFEGNKDHAEAKGTWEQKSGKMVCKPICKGSNYEPQWDNQTKTYTGCVQKSDHIGTKCPDNLLSKYPHASKLEISKEDPNGVATECKITACDKGYNLNEPNNSCDYCGCGMIWDNTEQKCKAWSSTKCDPMPTGATVATRACKDAASGEEKDASACQSENACVEFCKVTGCDEPAYTLVDGACQSSVGMPCPQLPEHATAGILNDKMECVVSACENGYEISPSGLACNAKMTLTKDQYQDKVAALADNAKNMREKETSLENRIIGATGIGMTGIGGSMVGSALSERAADISAEQAMAAYLQTFHCEYGDGKNIKGGEVNVELPGGNDMIELYQEYAQLANDLKIRKEALGIRPGIESEVVIDKSETGLYEYTPDGIDGGVYASIARAILNPDGEDAAMWAAQKAATQKKLVTGAVVAGVGAVGSGVANYVVNHDNPNKSDEIIKKYELMKQPFEHMQDSDNKQPEKTCAEMYPGATGSDLKNCRCTAQNAYLTNDGCIQCGPGFRVNDEQNGCICADSTKIEKDGQCVELPVTPAQEPALETDLPQECKLAAHLKEQQECKCVAGAIEEGNNECICNTSAGYVEYENSCICDSARGYTSDTNGNCTCNTTAGYTTQADGTCAHTASNTGTSIAQASLRADATQHTLFDSGKATLKDTTLLDTFITEAKATNIDLSKPEDYCIVIIGKTDHQGFISTSKYYGKGGGNQQLSTDRAKAVADYFAKKGVFANDSIRSYGIAATECPEPTAGASKANQECRRVDIKMLAGSCTTNFVNLANLLKPWQDQTSWSVQSQD